MLTAKEYARIQQSSNVQKILESQTAIIIYYKNLGFYEAIEKRERILRNSVFPSNHRSMKGSFKEVKKEFDKYSA